MDFLQRKKATKGLLLEEKPSRLSGQSVQEQVERQVDRTLEYVILMALVLALAIMEWFRWFFKSPPQPVGFTFLAFLICSYGILKILLTRRELKLLKQGKDGERVIGRSLRG